MRIYEPDGTTRAPALIFLHERYGLVQHTLDLCAKAARDGFVGVAPDLFSRWTGDRAALARGEIRVIQPDAEVAEVLHATIDEIKRRPDVDPTRILLAGVCQSGRYAMVVASERHDLAGCVVLYGAAQERDFAVTPDQPRAMPEMIAALRAPFLMLFGERDHVISLADVQRLRDAFEAARKSYRVRVFADMPHGWLNDTMPGRFRPEGTREAWAMILAFSREVFVGEWSTERVRWEFTGDTAPDYDFAKNRRYE